MEKPHTQGKLSGWAFWSLSRAEVRSQLLYLLMVLWPSWQLEIFAHGPPRCTLFPGELWEISIMECGVGASRPAKATTRDGASAVPGRGHTTVVRRVVLSSAHAGWAQLLGTTAGSLGQERDQRPWLSSFQTVDMSHFTAEGSIRG